MRDDQNFADGIAGRDGLGRTGEGNARDRSRLTVDDRPSPLSDEPRIGINEPANISRFNRRSGIPSVQKQPNRR